MTLYDIALNPRTEDLLIPPQMISGEQKVAQAIWISLTIFLGEWFLDTVGTGVPYFTDIMIKGASGSKIISILRNIIISVPDVTAVTNMNLLINSQTRQLGVSFIAITDLGPIVLAGPLGSTSPAVAVWGQTNWGSSVWGQGSTTSTVQAGVFDSSQWDNATWAQ